MAVIFAAFCIVSGCAGSRKAGQTAIPQERLQQPPEAMDIDSTAERDAVDMVFVKGGTFNMGCTAEQGGECGKFENPTHSVTLSDFYIAKYEMTQKLWNEVMGYNPSFLKGDNLPIDMVNWDTIQVFIQKLNAKTGKEYRLPTEAEWEYAARGGSMSGGFKYSGSDSIGAVAWYKDNSVGKTNWVGIKQPNELGIHDMSGNVWEWVSDWYANYSSAAQTNPTGPYMGGYRVARGGSWGNAAGGCRVSFRSAEHPTKQNASLGFRLAISPDNSRGED
jgi:formylglycine-generating enzyme required for sulfatase activity